MLTRVRPLGAGLALCQRWTPAVVERLLSGAAASASDHEDVPERFNSRTKRDNRLRYFVVSNQPSSALRLLEQTVFRVPMVDTSGREKFLKLPPASVCNKVLDSAAQEAQLTGRAAELADALLLQGIPLEAKTLRSLVMGLAGTGRLEDALPFLDRWLAAEEAERGRAGPQGAAAPDDDERGDGGSAPLAAPSPRHVHRTLSWLLEIAARRGSTPGIVAVLSRAARVQVVPSVQSVTEVLAACGRAREGAKARAILGWMRRHGLAAGPAQHAAALAQPAGGLPAAEAASLLPGAAAAAEEMRAEGHLPDAGFLAAWLRLAASAYDLAAARGVLGRAAELGLAGDDAVLAAFFDACRRCEDGGAALQALRAARGPGLPLGRAAQQALLAVLERCGDVPERAAEARRAYAAAPHPVPAATAAFMAVLLAEGCVDEALALAVPGPGAAAGGKTPDPGPASAWLFRAATRSRAAAGDWPALRRVAAAAHAARALASPADVLALTWAAALRSGSGVPGGANSPAWVLYQQEDAPLVRRAAPSPARRAAQREGAVAERLAATSLSDAVFRTCVLPGIAGGVEGATEGEETGRKDGGQALAALEALQSLGDTATPADRLAVLGRLVVLGDAAAAFALARSGAAGESAGGDRGAGTPGPPQLPTWAELRCLLYVALRQPANEATLVDYLLPLLRWQRHMPKEPAGAWWDERVERTVLHALKRAGQAGADKDEVAAGRALLDAR
ncbi:hypothetical protein ACKKBF_B15760 [Auxenochlorella protothecoides x Auxenochlorella symbiontica]